MNILRSFTDERTVDLAEIPDAVLEAGVWKTVNSTGYEHKLKACEKWGSAFLRAPQVVRM